MTKTYILMTRFEGASGQSVPRLTFVSEECSDDWLELYGPDLLEREKRKGTVMSPSLERPKKFRITIEEVE